MYEMDIIQFHNKIPGAWGALSFKKRLRLLKNRSLRMERYKPERCIS